MEHGHNPRRLLPDKMALVVAANFLRVEEKLDTGRLKELIKVLCKDTLMDYGYVDLPSSLDGITTMFKPQELREWKEMMNNYELELDRTSCNKESFHTINTMLFESGPSPGKIFAFTYQCSLMVSIAMTQSPLKVNDVMSWIEQFIDEHMHDFILPKEHEQYHDWRYTMLAIGFTSVCIGAYLNGN